MFHILSVSGSATFAGGSASASGNSSATSLSAASASALSGASPSGSSAPGCFISELLLHIFSVPGVMHHLTIALPEVNKNHPVCDITCVILVAIPTYLEGDLEQKWF